MDLFTRPLSVVSQPRLSRHRADREVSLRKDSKRDQGCLDRPAPILVQYRLYDRKILNREACGIEERDHLFRGSAGGLACEHGPQFRDATLGDMPRTDSTGEL